MLILFILTLAFLISGCPSSQQTAQPSATMLPASDGLENSYRWTRLHESGPWPKSYNFQLFSMKDSLWVFHPGGNWYSTDDGFTWHRSPLANVIRNMAFLDYIPFGSGLFGLGRLEGNIERFDWKPHIYFTDFYQPRWDTLSKQSTLPARYFYHPFEFHGKLWILGGEYQDRTYNDLWSSENGVDWNRVKESVEPSPRANSQIVNLHDTLYLLNHDVWWSTDAIHWKKITDAIVAGQEIFGYQALVWDDQIWLLGCNRNGRFNSEILVSKNGKDWNAWQAPWSPRGGVAAVVHHDKIFMTGGKYGGTPDHVEFRYDNDLWVLEKQN
jgi:hypothetical protein